MSKRKPFVTFRKRVTDVTPSYVTGSGRFFNGKKGTVRSLFRGDRVQVLYDADQYNGPLTFWVPYEFLRFE